VLRERLQDEAILGAGRLVDRVAGVAREPTWTVLHSTLHAWQLRQRPRADQAEASSLPAPPPFVLPDLPWPGLSRSQ